MVFGFEGYRIVIQQFKKATWQSFQNKMLFIKNTNYYYLLGQLHGLFKRLQERLFPKLSIVVEELLFELGRENYNWSKPIEKCHKKNQVKITFESLGLTCFFCKFDLTMIFFEYNSFISSSGCFQIKMCLSVAIRFHFLKVT